MKRTITLHQQFMLAVILLIAVGLNSLATAAQPKPRVLVLTDISTWETDDHESLIRFLAHADLFEIEGIVISTGYSVSTLRKSPEDGFINIARGVVDAYEKDLPNLIKRSNQTGHAFDDGKQEIGYWPSSKYLRDRVMLGSLNRGKKFIGDGNGSPGSDLIIKLADEDDSRPLWVTIWGGGNTLAQSIYQVKKDRTPAELKSFLNKLRAYAITDQDRHYRGEGLEVSSHGWIYEQTGNDLRFIWDESAWKAHNGVGKSNWEQYENHIQKHGNLGSQYPKYKFGVEGDTPAFLYLMPNGLNDPEDPTQASWGGNFKEDKNNLWREAKSCESNFKRFYPAAFNNFAARMDWAKDGKGNRNPHLVLDGDSGIDVLTKTPNPGTAVTLDASKTTDPDGDELQFNWWVQDDAGSYQGKVEIENSDTSKATVRIPIDAFGKRIHLICEVTDNGTHNLSSYRRVVFEPSGNVASSQSGSVAEPTAGTPYSPFPTQVVVTKVKHFDNMCWKIAAAGGTWYFENGETDGKTGFSSAFDQAGNDWIGNDADRNYNKSPSRGGKHEYRGWPNFGEGNFNHPQRSSGSKSWWVDADGKTVPFNGKLLGGHLIMRSANTKYELEYHFFPTHAAIKVLKAEDKYAFLFEGPIGGEQESSIEKDYYVLKDGKHRECKAGGLGYLEPEFGNKFPSPFFYLEDSDPNDPQVWYAGVKNTGPESAGDEGWRQGSNMVIFSFGRDEDKRAFTGTEAVCVFGFHPKAPHDEISNFITSRIAAPFDTANADAN